MNKLPLIDQWVTGLNLVFVAVSVVANWWAARSGLFRFRTIHAAIAAVSGLYFAGYTWLLFGDVEVTRWSSVMRGFSLLAWTVVWITPAVMSVRMNHDLHSAIKSRLDGEMSDRLDDGEA